MIYISAQPASLYYAWQAEVMINNFLSMGINPNDVHLVCSKENGKLDESWIKLKENYPVKIFFYDDTRLDKSYQPGVQSHILFKHWLLHPYLETESVFFHDVDFIFTRPFDFSPFLKDDIWYFSDTISYLGANYILHKGEEVLDTMCQSVGISKDLVIRNQPHSGGAQKLFKNITKEYWNQTYQNTIKLWLAMGKVQHIKKENDPYGIQRWTASMWGELWTGWLMGYEVRVPKEFDFCWATDSKIKWNELGMFHNAGVTNSEMGLFYKGNYVNRLPYGEDIKINDGSASQKYWEWVKLTGQKSVLL